MPGERREAQPDGGQALLERVRRGADRRGGAVKPLAFACHPAAQPVPLAAQPPSAPPPQQPVTEADPDAPQPKFIWGLLILKFAAGEVFSNFSQWTYSKLTGKPNESKTTTASAIDYLRGKGDTTGGARRRAQPLADPVPGFKERRLIALDRPSTPIVISQGAPNYQGVHISIAGADRRRNITDLRPVKPASRPASASRLRSIVHFGATWCIENINPKGERARSTSGRGATR